MYPSASMSTPLPIHDEAPELDVPAAAAVPPPTAELLGVPLALTDYERTMDWIDAKIKTRDKGYVCVAAVHTVMVFQEDAELREAVLASDLTVPDGQPIVWAMNAMGAHLSSRVYGPELMARHCARSAKTGARVFLYGGRNQGTLVQLALNLRRRYPGIRIVGGYSPPYRALTAEEDEAVVREINASGADIVWVGIGVPKQEKWMHAMRDRLDTPVLVGVGAAFDFHAGRVAQAPNWIQSMGMEWAYRLSREPRRLWKRYTVYNPKFVLGLVGEYLRQR